MGRRSRAPAPPISGAVLATAAEVIKCMGHPLRLRLLEALEDGERSVSELRAHSGASQSAVSQQLAILKAKGIVECRREGTHVLYRVTEPKVTSILGCIRSCDVRS